jgi:hypothetical protein
MKKIFYPLSNIFTILFLFFFYSCEKDLSYERTGTQKTKLNLTEEVCSKNGVLIFKDSLSLKKVMNNLAFMSRKEATKWEENFDFISQRTIFENIVDAELEIDEPYEKMTEEERKNATLPPEHSQLYYEMLNYGIIKVIKDIEDPEYESYDFSVCLPFLTPILNKDGIFMTGNTIYQVTSKSIKQWDSGDFNNLEKLKSTTECDQNIKIISINNINGTNNGLKSELSPNPLSTGWIKKGSKRRMKLEEYFKSWKYLSDGTIWRYQHYIHVRSEKKNWLGKWKLNWTDMSLRGTMEASFVYYPHKDSHSITSSLDYSSQFPSNYPSYYVSEINNFYASMSIFDGTPSPYPATWNVYYQLTPGENVEIKDIYLLHADWVAICHGDAKGTIKF